MQRIDRDMLKQKIERGDPFCLIDVLAPQEYEAAHIPGAINVPLDREFGDKIPHVVPDKSTPIVVYCSSEACDASPKAARLLEDLGYRNVLDYAGGKDDWHEGGLKLVDSSPEA